MFACKFTLYNNFERNERIYNSEFVCEYNVEKEKDKKSLFSVIDNKMDFLLYILYREKPNKMENKIYTIIILQVV